MVITDYARAKSLFHDTEVAVFKKGMFLYFINSNYCFHCILYNIFNFKIFTILVLPHYEILLYWYFQYFFINKIFKKSHMKIDLHLPILFLKFVILLVHYYKKMYWKFWDVIVNYKYFFLVSVYLEVEQRIEKFRETLLQKLKEQPSTVDEQKRLVK